MLGLEKKVDAMRQMQGDEGVEPQGPGRTAATTSIMLALVGIVLAVAVYFTVEGKYSAKMKDYDARIAAMDARVAEALKAPGDMARKAIAASALGEMSGKVDILKGQLDASYQERLAKVEEALKSMRADLAK